MLFRPFPQPLCRNRRIPSASVALIFVQTINTAVIAAYRHLILIPYRIQQLCCDTAMVVPAAVNSVVFLLHSCLCVSLMHITSSNTAFADYNLAAHSDEIWAFLWILRHCDSLTIQSSQATNAQRAPTYDDGTAVIFVGILSVFCYR